ncbi:glucose 1-dehydrogenase [Nocardia sp. NPDC003482]
MTANAFRFHDKTALITGGTSGMGLATARRLRDEGARVVITGRDESRLAAAARELGDDVLAVRGDAADLTDLDALAATIRDRYGRLDIVFANAGIGAFQPFHTVTERDFDRVVAGNVKSVFFTVQRMLPLLPDHAAIILNASFAAHRGTTSAALYSATKAAVHSLARTLATELAPRRIRVNSISPGYTDTPAFRADTSLEAQTRAAATVPAGRLGAPNDIAAAVAFLASAEAAYVNGRDLTIDGGLTSALTAPL